MAWTLKQGNGLSLMRLPSPNKIGLPKQYSEWREGQSSSILRLIDSPKRFVALVQPTGSGKSLTYASYLKLAGGKSVILTSTKSLQDQIQRDFSSLGYSDVRGQSNYPCVIDPPLTVDLGPCHAGLSCDLKRGGCPYYDAVAEGKRSAVTVTNYSWWLHTNAYGEGFPPIDTLILDEAHAAPDELADFLSCEFSREHVKRFLSGYAPPPTKWNNWAAEQAVALEGELEHAKYRALTNKKERRNLRTAQSMLLKLHRLAKAEEGDWVVEEEKRGWRFDPVWPGPYSEMLFRQTPKVILVSATMRPKTLALLNLKPEDYDFHESPSTFPISRRPVYFFVGQPRLAITHRSDDSVLRLWLARIDNILRRRLDRKGILHCVSYARRDFILRNSRFADHMLSHDSGEQAKVVERFKAARPPAFLLSPSATTGLDFPYQEAEVSIIAKCPFPDQRSKILKARAKKDPDYAIYLTCLDIVQASGRGMRAADDQHEVFIVDDQIQWLISKYRRFFPEWWLEAVRRIETIPDPPKRLDSRNSGVTVAQGV